MKLFEALVLKFMSLAGLTGLGASAAGYWPTVREPFAGAWQKGTVDRKETILTFSAVYACVTGIASDIAKLRIKIDRNNGGIWEEIAKDNAWLPVLRKPNHYQNRIKFLESWMVSILLNGNAYILKERDARGIVSALYPLAPLLVTPMLASDGSIFYQLQIDLLSRQDIPAAIVPASEIIHDRAVCLWHPLIGVPPIYACALSATMGNKIESYSTGFFDNRALPGGVLTAPGTIATPTAERIRDDWQKNFGGANMGRVAVLGDGLKFEAMQMTNQNAQLAEQLKFSVEDIARAFHYPAFKLGGQLPSNAANIESLITGYYTDCLQAYIENIELSLDEGLELPNNMGTELDLEGLMRMDTAALYETNSAAVGGGWMSPDEARFKANLKPVAGGTTPYLQQQNYSLAALAKRDALDDPFGTTKPQPPPAPEINDEADDKPEPPAEKNLELDELRAHSFYAIRKGKTAA